ncbi:uncharacterized protein [Onthophagus taurus]|uniref:uncharacterized protein n=1 Tax=Onthophagus taurus TaxID=166361 RepID=UPI0039BEC0C3
MERARRNLNRDGCVQIVTLSIEGLTNREHGRRFGVAHTTVGRVLQRFVETNDYARRPGQGRPRATNAVEERYLMLRALRELSAPSLLHQIQLSEVPGTAVSQDTIRRRLCIQNLQPRAAATGPRLSADHRRNRLAFARRHVYR